MTWRTGTYFWGLMSLLYQTAQLSVLSVASLFGHAGGILWTFFYLHHINLHGNSSTPYHLLGIIFWPNLKPGFHDYYKPFYDVEDSPGCKPTKDSKGTMCLAALVLKLKNGGQKTWFSLALLGMTAGHTKKGSKSEELFTFGNSLKKGERGAQKDLLSRWCFPPFYARS